MGAAGPCEVLVVGAGPTGLMAAVLLKRAGVHVRIVEQRAEATRESRAFAVQARTLELMQALGLANEFVSQGVRANSVNIHVKGRFRGGLNFTRARATDTPFPFILMIPQSRTEAILAKELERLNVAIERGVTVASLDQDAEGVTVTTESGESIRCAYIIGADGSRSIVRQAGGLGWHGELLPQRFLLADCKVDWPLDHDNFRVFLNGQRIGLFLPLDGERLSRVMATDLSGSFGDENGSKPAPLDLAEMQEGLQAALALPVTLSDPAWVTRYRAHHRFTDRYRAGRIFVAGDAAHIHSPAGGQGMNTGLQDAANLAWKLAAILNGGDPALLDSYDAERRPVGEAVVKSTGKLFAAAAGQSGTKAAVRDRAVSLILPIISRLPPFQRKAFFNASQRAVAYPRGAFVGGDAYSGSAAPGKRAPDAPLADGGTVFARIGEYRFHTMVVSRRTLTQAEADRLGAHGDVALIAGTQPESGVVFDRYGVHADHAVTLLIRPDGYVAWRKDGVALDECAAFLRQIAGNGPSVRAAAA